MPIVVVSDTGPLNYLIQIAAVELLPKLFGRILVPIAVQDELRHPHTPIAVRDWIAQPPPWLDIRQDHPDLDSNYAIPPSLDEGEAATIALASEVNADLILMDDRQGVSFARAQGFAVTGPLWRA